MIKKNNENSSRLIFTLFLCVYLTCVILYGGTSSNAKYGATLNGSDDGKVAKLVYEIDSKEVFHNGSYVQIAFTKGTVGQFKFMVANHKIINLIDTPTQVSFKVKVEIKVAVAHDITIGRLLESNALFNSKTVIAQGPQSSVSANGFKTYYYAGYSNFTFGRAATNRYFVIEISSNTPSVWEDLNISFTVEQID